MRRRLFALAVCAAALSLPRAVAANDAAIAGVGGRLRLLEGEHRQVRMVRETVRVDLNTADASYDVSAEFVFRNEGPAVTVTMGFPETGGGADFGAKPYATRSAFRSFATWVDGAPTPAARARVRTSGDDEYEAFWVKTVRFGANQTRRVRVLYRAACGTNAAGERFAVYDFTGGNWRGSVDESTLLVTLSGPGVSGASVRAVPLQQLSSLETRGGRYFFRWVHWQAQSRFQFYFKTAGDSAS